MRNAPPEVAHPKHYTEHPSGIECITITRHFNFCLGNVIKYVWRAGLKSKDPIQDLEKARQYLDFEIDRLKAEKPPEKKPMTGITGITGIQTYNC